MYTSLNKYNNHLQVSTLILKIISLILECILETDSAER